MCGIAGLFHTDDRAVSEGEVRRMVDTMVHRGPDGEGICACGPIGLGMRRLAIIDVQGGNQPIWNEDRTYAAFGQLTYSITDSLRTSPTRNPAAYATVNATR